MSDYALEVLHQMASGMNTLNRRLFPDIAITPRIN